MLDGLTSLFLTFFRLPVELECRLAQEGRGSTAVWGERRGLNPDGAAARTPLLQGPTHNARDSWINRSAPRRKPAAQKPQKRGCHSCSQHSCQRQRF